ncbi:MAG: DUF4125 family protein [Solidesulfovibrio sp. DCME]|uniref:DUF4125 family protein n=1 Tax=Solidesulfovibrio sp. DCME TaxID=3447380 RepID=UPI003D13A6CC
MIRLAVVGDSLGLPRFSKGSDRVDLYHEDTYPERLRRRLRQAAASDVMLVNLCRHAQTSLHLVRGLATDVFLARPHIVIVELGLTDLWPARGRHVPPPFPDLADKDPWVEATDFHRNLDRFLGFCRDAMGSPPPGVVLVNLWEASPDQYARHPEALPRTRRYNTILGELAARHGAGLCDAAALCRELGPPALCGDGIHWTPAACDALAGRLCDLVLRQWNAGHGDAGPVSSLRAGPGPAPRCNHTQENAMATQRETVLQAIIDAEQEMFCALNTGEDQNTPEKIKPFRLGRWMSFSVLSDEVIDSYLLDLIQARKEGRNLMTEKYALMAGQIPAINVDPVIEDIVAAESAWMLELADKYPHVVSHGTDNAAYFRQYTACELQTYSSHTLELLLRDIEAARQAGLNLAEQRYDNFYTRIGKGSLRELEAAAAAA